MASASEIIAAAAVELFFFGTAAVVTYRLWRIAPFLPQRKTLAAFHRGVLLRGDRVVLVVEKNSCWVKPRQTLLAVDTRARTLQTSLRDLPTSDNLYIRVRFTGEYRVSDVAQFVRASQNAHDSTYLALEREIANAVAETDRKELLSSREGLATRVKERVEPRAAELGVHFLSLEVSDLIGFGWNGPTSED